MEIAKIQEQIKEIEQEIRGLPYHKGTEHHIGKLKAKLAKLRELTSAKSLGRGGGKGYAPKKSGDATVVLIGFPSVGKSTLLNKLTGAESKVASYPFTTLDVIPGILDYKGAKIQIFDVPGLIEGSSQGKGKGKEVLSVSRIADLLLLMASAENPKTIEIIEKELYLAGVRQNEKRPEVLIEKKQKGGIEVSGKVSISKKTIKSLVQEFGILNAKVTFKNDINEDQLIDTLLGNRVYLPAIKVLSKIDLISKKELKNISKKIKDCVLISAEKNKGLEELKETIFQGLNVLRIYLRKTLKGKTEKDPLICKKDITVFETATKISKELAKQIKGAKITGSSAAYPNQFVGLNHKLQDKDEVFFVK